MIDVFDIVKNNLQEDRRIPTKTLITLNPSSQVCYDEEGNQMGSCLRQIWLEKTDQAKTNPIGLAAVMSGFSGNWWEDWFIDQLKETGLYYTHSVPLTDVNNLVKGIVDVILKNPNTTKLELGEIKTYNGSNYHVGVSILGNKSTKPKPRDKHLLQAFRYSLMTAELFEVNNLFYIDRSCASFFKNKQFKVELIKINNVTYPKISTIHLGEYYEYVDTRISDVGIQRAESALLSHLGSNTIPDKEFIEEYDNETIQSKYMNKEIPQYIYDKYIKDPINNPIGDTSCKYCAFASGTCKNWS